MRDPKICRICLRTEAKVYHFDQFNLKSYYEEVMASKVNANDQLPPYFCFECALMLHKFHKFKEKCYGGQKVLKEQLWKGPITREAVYKVDRNGMGLQSSMGVMILTKRIKSFYIVEPDIKILIVNDDMKFPKKEIDVDENAVAEDYIPIENVFGGEESNAQTSQIIKQERTDVESEHRQITGQSRVQLKEGRMYQENDIIEEVIEESEINQEVEIDNTEEVVYSVDDVMEHGEDVDQQPPVTMYMNENNEPIPLDLGEIKGGSKRKFFKEFGNEVTKYHASKKTKVLDANFWRKHHLSEEEALKAFRARAGQPKYLKSAFKCTDCLKGFSKADMLNRHIQLRHSESLGQYECRFCHMRFKWDGPLRAHMRQHFIKYECLRCPLVCELENTAKLHEEYHSGVTRKCIHCGEIFRHLSTYYTHLRTVHRSDFICSKCGVSFVSELGLHNHKLIKHVNDDIESADDEEEWNTYCERCDILFETRKAYEEHVFHSSLHTEGVEHEIKNEVDIPRKILGKRQQQKITKRLRGKSDNAEEMVVEKRRTKRRKRSRTKPMTCYQCGKHFETQSACQKHHLENHPGTSFTPPNERHICEICGVSLAPCSVPGHQNLHTHSVVHACPTCGREFHSKIGLKRHLVCHTGEKPYPCPLCDKKFTQSNSMKLHYRTYHLKQPYPKRNRRKKRDQDGQSTDQTTDDWMNADESNSSQQELEVEEIGEVEMIGGVDEIEEYEFEEVETEEVEIPATDVASVITIENASAETIHYLPLN